MYGNFPQNILILSLPWGKEKQNLHLIYLRPDIYKILVSDKWSGNFVSDYESVMTPNIS